MNQFSLQQGVTIELEQFPHIREFALQKNATIQLNSFIPYTAEYLQIFCVTDGKFEWAIDQREYVLFPGDVAFVLPGQRIGGSKGFLDIGAIFRLQIEMKFSESTDSSLGSWSTLSPADQQSIERQLLVNNMAVLFQVKEAIEMLQQIHAELMAYELGRVTRVNHLLDSLLIMIARQSTRQADSRRDFPRTFMKLEQALRNNLAHQWTVEEMATLFGLGTTSFTERVKHYTGFSPLNYLINIRISEAIKLLKQPNVNFTDIALDTGFYSSQHFSTTFKKLTGYTPGEFRKRSVPNDTN
ncbi:MAG: AraC family transcriptional regulator [Chryseolinea sp.]